MQQVKDLALSLQWLRSLLRLEFSPRTGNFPNARGVAESNNNNRKTKQNNNNKKQNKTKNPEALFWKVISGNAKESF